MFIKESKSKRGKFYFDKLFNANNMKDWSDLNNPMEDRNRTCLKNYDDQDK